MGMALRLAPVMLSPDRSLAGKGMVRDMTTIGGSWVVTLLVAGAMLVFLGLTFLFITRSARGLSVLARCPITGHTAVVQHICDESGYVTDMVSCGAYPDGQPITCGVPCLTGGVPARVIGESVDLVRG
jgi:hypothetical protein